MTIKTLKDLEATMKLCAKHGIRSLKVGNIEMQVELPVDNTSSVSEATGQLPPQYTETDYTFWSAGSPVTSEG